MNDKISVITVSYNAANVIEPTIKSVISQTYDNIEFIIIDGGSNDGTLEIINKYRSRISQIVSEPDKGIYDGMNKGIKKSKGDWLIFMNAGDRFLTKETVKNIFVGKEFPDSVGVIYGRSYGTMGTLVKLTPKQVPFWENRDYLHNSGICHQASFVSRKAAIEHPFNLTYKHAADMNMFIEVYNAGYKFKSIDDAVCLFDLTDNFGKRNPWSGVKEQALILKRYGTIRFYMSIIKDAFIIKPKSWLARNIKLLLETVSPKCYQNFIKARGWRNISEVTSEDWGIVDQRLK